jgi:magnesium-protoporphyrin IX monomethyl ester (oxidative) cyclase
VGIDLAWNLLTGFPNEEPEWYEETRSILPLISHLQPPTGVCRVSFDRFSPYHEQPDQYGISDLAPHPSYFEAFLGAPNVNRLAYHFIGNSSALKATDNVLRALQDVVGEWRSAWAWHADSSKPPCLEVVELGDEGYLLIDTRRRPKTTFVQSVTREQASVALVFRKEESEVTVWGESVGVCLRTASGFIPLACAAPSTIKKFEEGHTERTRYLRTADIAVMPVTS